MKTNYIYTILTLFFCLNATSQMANDKSDDPWDNLQNSINNFLTDASDVLDKSSRWYWIRKNDIRMWMNAQYEEDESGFSFYSIDEYGEGRNDDTGAFMSSTAHEGSIYGEFDWDNKALMLEGTTTAYETTYKAGIKGNIFEDTKKNPKEIIVQYTDKDGYWYVPVQFEGLEDDTYVKFNAKQMAIEGLKDMMDLNIEVIANNLEMFVRYIELTIDWDREDLGGLLGNRLQDLIKAEDAFDENLNEALQTLLNEELAEKVGFPVFIHWALMYSPESIKAQFNVSDNQATFRGNPNCRKLTVLSGSEKGKSMTFDQYGRLVFINALKEGTARFAYDKDVTVKLPKAVDMADLMGGLSKLQDQNRDEQETKKNYVKIIERLKREEKKKEEILDYVEKEIRELEVKKERAITKKERDEYQDIIDELKDILEKESN